MRIPESYTRTPQLLRTLVAGRPVRRVWTDELGGHTWAIGEPAEEYIKVVPAHPEFDLVSEAEQMRWVGNWVPVPEVIDAGTGTDLPISVERIAAMRAEAPPLDAVVCHGDACSPNFLIDDGRCTGYVDLGDLGIADRWADLAPAVLSLGWNFGGLPTAARHQTIFLDAYGIDLDADKLDYYIRLWRLGVLPIDVVDAFDGGLASDAGMGSVVIVVMNPGLVGGCSGRV